MKATVDPRSLRLIALDLDGTLVQHKCCLEAAARDVLDALGGRYRLVINGAGPADRIDAQLGHYPIDILGNYGMQFLRRDSTGLHRLCDRRHACDRASVSARVEQLRREAGLRFCAGAPVVFHETGCISIPLIGAEASLLRKLAFDPDYRVRNALFPRIQSLFPEYSVFIAGTTSFDMVPRPYDKYHALDEYCRSVGFAHGEVLAVGDDYGERGNDYPLCRSDFPFLPIDDYRALPERLAFLLA